MKFAYAERPMEPLIGATEAAEYLGFSPLSVRKMAHAGVIPFFAFPYGRKITRRFRVSDLEAYLATVERNPIRQIRSPPEGDHPACALVRAGDEQRGRITRQLAGTRDHSGPWIRGTFAIQLRL